MNKFCIAAIIASGKTIAIVAIAILAVAILVTLIGSITVRLKRRNALIASKDNGVVEVKNIRVTSDKALLDNPNGFKFLESDIILSTQKTYTVSRSGAIKPGKYKILSADDKQKKANVRIGTYVREYGDNTDIVLAEGEQITAISHKIILR